MIQLDYRDTRPIYLQIADGFREQIAAGVLQPGEKLPSVRDLACQLTINPNTIQRSYRELELQGWIASVGGKGSFVWGIPEKVEAEQAEMLKQFDQMVENLISLGISREKLIHRMEDGGERHA